MREASIRSGQTQDMPGRRVEAPGSALPAWWVVFTRELADLWIGGKALNLILIYGFLLGIMSFAVVSTSELDFVPPKEMVFFALQIVISVGLFISVINGADSLSGERERATLEALLLTPTSRRQIVVGKFLAAVSPWPATLAIGVPYLSLLSQGDEILGPAVLWGGALGSLLALGFTGLAMLVSFRSNSNRTSFFVSLTIYLMTLVPTQWPGRVQKGLVGKFVQRVNPMEATNEFLEKILVNHRTLHEFRSWLASPVVFAGLVFVSLFLYASPRLRFQARRQ